MKTKRQLNKKIKDLELQIHTKKYIHIPRPSLKGIGKFSLMIVCAFLSYLNLMLILKFSEDCDFLKLIDLIIIYPIVGEFVLISLTVVLGISLLKKLKNYNEEGIIHCLVYVLISGLMGGLILGFVSWIIVNSIEETIGWIGFMLAVMLPVGLGVGMAWEFD